MAIRRPKTCKFPYCQKPEDLDRDCDFCAEHAERWLQSHAFREASRDESVQVCFALGLMKQVRREVSRYRRRWAKTEAEREGGA